ncbi:MAG: hypothetical protein ACD_83C00198G0002, partial [uncultured bacterium]
MILLFNVIRYFVERLTILCQVVD